MDNNDFLELIKKGERYDILVNLLKKNIKKYNDSLMITNDRVIIDFLQAIEEVQFEEIPKMQ